MTDNNPLVGAVSGLLNNMFGIPPQVGMQRGHQNFRPNMRQGSFQRKFVAMPPAYWNNEDPMKLEKGDKIVIPASALDDLSRMNIQFPIMFRITNVMTGRHSHCSVLEFTAPEGNAYLPLWMFENLQLDPNSTECLVSLVNVPLEKGTYVQLQPHSTAFTELSNPKAVLEKALRGFSCLTKGDTIKISFSEFNQNFYLDIVELKPREAVSIIETDISVDFKEPKDYAKHLKERERNQQKKIAEEMKAEEIESKMGDNVDPIGALFSSSQSSYTASPKGGDMKKQRKDAYFSGLDGGNKLNGKPISRGQSLGSSGKKRSGKKKKEEEVVGNMRYIYEVDEDTDERTLIRRLPLRSNIFGGSGHKAKG